MAKQTQTLVAANANDEALHVAGFTVLPIRYSARHLKHGTVHYLFIRTNQSTSQQRPHHRTLFVANLPTDTSPTHLRTLFKNAGALERIHFQHNTSTRPLAGQHIIDALTSTQPEHDDHDHHDDDDDDDDEPDLIQPQGEPNAALLQSKLEEQNTRKRNKRKRKQDQQQQNAPHVTPLPPLDPRELPYLPTATSAHIIFLDDSSLQRALAQAHLTSAAFVAAGGPALLLPSASPKKAELLALLKAARPWPADSSTTTTTNTTQQPQTQAQPPPPAGLPTLLASYQSHRPSLPTIKSFTDTRIALHSFLRLHPHLDPTEQARAQRRTAIQAVSVGAQGELLDSDGFTIVTAGGKYGRTAETGSKVGVEGASVRVARNRPYMASGDAFDAEKGPPRKKSKSKDLEDFYRFQTREKNREKLAQLRAKFQEDKVKVAKLKESRKFKPY